MIEIVSPEAEDWELFSEIIPAEKCIPSDSKVMYAALDNSDQGTEVCGVLIVDFEFRTYQIDYLYVIPEKRRTGVATKLIDNLIEKVKSSPFDNDVVIDLIFTSQSAGLCYFFAGRDDFDMIEGFSRYRVYAGSLSQFPQILKLVKHYKKSGKAKLLSECSEKNWNYYITELKGRGLDFAGELKPEDLDEELTQFRVDEEGNPQAVLAIQKPENDLLRVLFMGSISNDSTILIKLLAGVFTEYKKKYEKMYLEFVLSNPEMEKLIEYMFGDYALKMPSNRFIYNWSTGDIEDMDDEM